MRHLLSTLSTTLTLGLLGASVCLAGPRPVLPHTPTPPALTQMEAVCHAYGVFALNRAADRDAGLSLMAALSASRLYDRQGRVGPQIEQIHDDLTRAIYALPQLTPTMVQQQTEVWCLRGAADAQAQTPLAGSRSPY